MLLSDVCLTSFVYIRHNPRTERPIGRLKLAQSTRHHFQNISWWPWKWWRVLCANFSLPIGLSVLGLCLMYTKDVRQTIADVLNSQHDGTGATWRINTKYCQLVGADRGTWLPPACSLLQERSLVRWDFTVR